MCDAVTFRSDGDGRVFARRKPLPNCPPMAAKAWIFYHRLSERVCEGCRLVVFRRVTEIGQYLIEPLQGASGRVRQWLPRQG
jgi:hypothetical protein